MASDSLATELSAEEFRRFRDLVQRHSGIYLEDSKHDSLRISLITRATRLGLSSLRDYYATLENDEHEFNELLNLVTINETSFFRFPQQFDALRDRVLPEIMENRLSANKTLRFWSAGCSTGEEPYSISMALLDLGIEQQGWSFQTLGTDVSTKALSVAQTGVFGRRATVSVTPEILQRHFEHVGPDQYRVNDEVRRCVDFGYHNLIKEPYPLSLMGNWDVIFCRNVTIYFRLESTRRVVENFYNSLNDGGYLFIGHSETLTSINDAFQAVETGGVFLYRKPPARRLVPAEKPARVTRPKTAPVPAAKPAAVRRPPKPAPGPAPGEESPLLQASRMLREGRPAQALETVAFVLETDPDNAEAHLLSAYVYADSGQYEEALEACNRALTVNPLMPVARYILGIIHQRQGDVVRAVSELKKTIYIDPDFALAHLNLANIYKAQRKWEAAAREYENATRALDKSPEGQWTEFLGGFKVELLAKTCERSLLECRKAMGVA